METNSPEPVTENNNTPLIVMISLAILFSLLCLCLIGFVFFAQEGLPAVQKYLPSQKPLPTETLPVAAPVVHTPEKDDQVIESDFSDDAQIWQSKWQSGKVQVADGHLTLQSSGNNTGIALCESCRFTKEHFYIEADFSSSQKTTYGYGIAFNISSAYGGYDGSYYLFQINVAKGRYFLYKFEMTSSGVWMLRLSNSSLLVKAYPQSNKLGVAFNKDTLELFLNGTRVETYQDPGTILNAGRFGFYVDGPDFELNVDNLFSYGK